MSVRGSLLPPLPTAVTVCPRTRHRRPYTLAGREYDPRAAQGPGVEHDLPSQILSQQQPLGMLAVEKEVAIFYRDLLYLLICREKLIAISLPDFLFLLHLVPILDNCKFML